LSLRLYMDEHVPNPITEGLRARDVDVLTVQEDGMVHRPDPELLDRAAALGRVMFTQDVHFLQDAVARQRLGEHFRGVSYGHQLRVTIGSCVHGLGLLAKVSEPEELADRIVHLPLR